MFIQVYIMDNIFENILKGFLFYGGYFFEEVKLKGTAK